MAGHAGGIKNQASKCSPFGRVRMHLLAGSVASVGVVQMMADPLGHEILSDALVGLWIAPVTPAWSSVPEDRS